MKRSAFALGVLALGIALLALLAWLRDERPLAQSPQPISKPKPKPRTSSVSLPPLVLESFDKPTAAEPQQDSAPTDGVIRRDHILKEHEGAYSIATPHYGATFSSTGLDFVVQRALPGLDEPGLQYTFEEARVGGTRIEALPASPHAEPAERAVAYSRGGIEERYILLPQGVEQIFILRELPVRGDIAIIGRVTSSLTAPVSGTVASALSFTHLGQEAIRISEAVAIDASGRKQELTLAYDAGRVQIIVPGAWVAQAALPITIDPMIGSPLTVDSTVTDFTMTVDSQYVRVCDVAYNSVSNEYLVVWSEKGSSSFNHHVFGQRVSATGTLVGSIINIANTTAGEYECSVSYAPGTVNKYLVVWRHDPTSGSPQADDQRIMARVVNGDGTVPAAAFTVEDPAKQDYAPSVAYDGTNWAVVYTNAVSGTEHNIRGRFVSTAGTPGASFTVDTVTTKAARPSIAFANGVYCIVWDQGNGTTQSIYARTMSPTGTFPTNPTEVDQSTLDSKLADVTAAGTNFLIAWQHAASGSNKDILARVSTSTLTFSTSAFNVKTGSGNQESPRLAYSTTSSLGYTVHTDSLTGSTDVYGERVLLTGSASLPEIVANGSAIDRRPEIAWNSSNNEMLVVFVFGGANPYQIRAQRVSLTAPPAPAAPVITTPSKKVKIQTPVIQGTAEANSIVTVYYNAVSAGTTSSNGTGAWTFNTPTKPEGVYSVYARTSNSTSQSANSNTITITIDITPPPVPTNIRTTAYSGIVDVEWDAVTATDLAGYYVSRKIGPTGTWTQLHTNVVLGTKYRDSSVTNGTTYFYRVTSIDDALPN